MSWKPRMPILICAVVLSILFAGCARTKTILVPEGTPVRLRESIPNASVWVYDGSGSETEGFVDLRAGWWVLSDPGDG